jgi:plastocyanin
VQAVAACQSAGDWETMSRLVSQKYLGQVYGGGPSMSRATFVELAKSFPPTSVRFRDFEDFRLGDGGALASVKLIVGNQLTLDRMTFVESSTKGAWLIDGAETRRVDPPRDHDEVRITIQDNRYDPAALTAKGANIELVVSNEDEVDHEVLVLRFDQGIDASILLTSRGPRMPAGVHYLGQVTVPAGDTESLVLVTMRPGSVALVDLLPNDLGVPHLALGMEGTLTVTE